MAIHVIGGSPERAPFDRTFFQVTLGDLIERAGRGENLRLTLYLLDGGAIEVCSIEEVRDSYLVVRTFRGDEDACGAGLNLIPYGLIYRIELAPRESGSRRMGFHWAPPPDGEAQSRSRARPPAT